MPGHAWTGLAVGADSVGNRLYAADFANNHIDVFDGSFAATTVSGGFIDPTVPAGYAPFNVRNIGGSLYVTYAEVGTAGRSANGPRFGYVRKFDTDGVKDAAFAIDNGPLDAPWGLALAPASFGVFGGALLVGNFSFDGDARVSAFDKTAGAFLGQLQDESGRPVSIDGFGRPDFDAQLEANKRAYFDEFVTRPEFTAKSGGTSNAAFVDRLAESSRFDPTVRDTYVARLEGSQVVPPKDTPASGVVIKRGGTARFGTTAFLSISLSLSNLSSPEAGAHVHGAAPPGSNAPVLLDLPLGEFTDFKATLTKQQFENDIYVDVHTEGNPDGEIRGQMPPRLTRGEALTRALDDGLLTRAQVLRLIAEDGEIHSGESPAFVLMEYFGYLRRDPDDAGFDFWLRKLTDVGGDFSRAEMVKAFISSAEYRRRFGP